MGDEITMARTCGECVTATMRCGFCIRWFCFHLLKRYGNWYACTECYPKEAK